MKPHVLVARLDSAGDVLLAGPAIRAMAAGARWVTLLCGPRGREAAELLPGVDEIRTFHSPWVDHEPPAVHGDGILSLVADIRAISVDEALILTSRNQSPLPLALLLRMAGVTTIAGASEDYAGSLLDIRQPLDDHLHEVERGLALAARLGHRLPRGDDGGLRLRRPEGGAGVRGLPPAPFIAIHPGAAAPARTWAPERWRELAGALADRGHSIVVTGGPGEEELARVVAGGDGSGRPAVTVRAGTDTLAGLAGLLRSASVLVAGNTGPAHLAAAVGTPVVSLFPPTVPAHRWRPWRVEGELLGNQEIECAGCRALTCPVPGHPCVGSVPLDEVVRAAERFAGSPARAEAYA